MLPAFAARGALKWRTMPLWLSESDVRAVLAMGELIDAMELALIAFSAGRVVQPVRTVLEIRERSFFGLMPALDSDGSMLGTKLVTVLPENTAKGLPSHQAAIVLFDPASGALLAVTDGRYITEARTAAVSAVSVRHMARRDASVLAIIGPACRRTAIWRPSRWSAISARSARGVPTRRACGNSRRAATSDPASPPRVRFAMPMWWCWPPLRLRP